MKKNIVSAAALVAATASLACAAELGSGAISNAGVEISGSVNGGAYRTICKLSNHVKASIVFTDTAYAVTTKHDSGNTQYGTSSDDSAIYARESNPSTTLSAPAAVDAATAYDGWIKI